MKKPLWWIPVSVLVICGVLAGVLYDDWAYRIATVKVERVLRDDTLVRVEYAITSRKLASWLPGEESRDRLVSADAWWAFIEGTELYTDSWGTTTVNGETTQLRIYRRRPGVFSPAPLEPAEIRGHLVEDWGQDWDTVRPASGG